MTEKDIVRLAEEAELWLHSDRKYEAVKKFAELVASAEREACAMVAESYVTMEGYGDEIAYNIRARGQHD